MFAMNYLNLQMFWPQYIHECVDTDEPIITVKHGHRQANGYAGNILEKEPHCKIKETKPDQCVSLAHTNGFQTPQINQ